jgi:hypothetical protein
MTQYYCNICRSTITEGEYRYSKEVFGKALCREHQDAERNTQRTRNVNTPQETEIIQSPKPVESKVIEKESKIGLSGIVKKVAITTSKVIKKSANTVVDTTRTAFQRREWKEEILRIIGPTLIKELARERNVRPSYDEGRPTIDDYIQAIKNNVTLDDIVSFANRNKVNIRDILTEMEYYQVKQEKKEILRDGDAVKGFYEQVFSEIKSFYPSGRHNYELPYQMELFRFLKARFPEAGIEQPRGSSRPDITINGIGIEVKGPTRVEEIQTIMEKCARYCPSHPKGVIVVLFDNQVPSFRYQEWLKDFKNRFPEVRVISKK